MSRQTFRKGRCHGIDGETRGTAERGRTNGARARQPIRANHMDASRRLAAVGERDRRERDALRHMGTYVPATFSLTSMPHFAVERERSENVEDRREERCCRHGFTAVAYVMARPLT